MRILRRLSQLLVFLLFVFLFLNTEYKDNDVLPYAVNLFPPARSPDGGGRHPCRAGRSSGWSGPRWSSRSSRSLLGRFFCGWFCPLGAVIDVTDATVFRKLRRKDAVPRSWRQVQVPCPLLPRCLLAVHAAMGLPLRPDQHPHPDVHRLRLPGAEPCVKYRTSTRLYRAPGPDPQVSEPVYGFLKSHFLAFEQPVFRTSAFVGLLFLGILVAGVLPEAVLVPEPVSPRGRCWRSWGGSALFRRRITRRAAPAAGFANRTAAWGRSAETLP